jgi:dienelactone hydrolase
MGSIARRAAGFVVGAFVLASVAFAMMRSRSPEPPRSEAAPGVALPPPPLPDPGAFDALDAFVDARIDSIVSLLPNAGALVEAETARDREMAVHDLRAAVAAAFPPAPRDPAASARERRPWFERDGVRVDQLHLETATGAMLPAVILTPSEPISSTRAAVLALHGERATWESLLTDSDYHHGFALELARRGFVVLAPLRALGNGRQRYHVDVKGKLSGLSVHAVALWEAQTALDYLTQEPGVDPERIGIYGISNGGEVGLRLAALDDRPAAVVISNYIAERRAWTLEGRRPLVYGVHMNVLHEGAVLLDDANLVALIQPRPLAVVVGDEDARLAQARTAFQDIVAVYRAVGYADNVRLIVTDAGHEIAIDSVVPFLDQHLRTNSRQK